MYATIEAGDGSLDQLTPRMKQTSTRQWIAVLLALICAAVLGGGLPSGPVHARQQSASETGPSLGEELSSDRANLLATEADLVSASRSGEKIDTSSAQAWELDDGNIYVNYSFDSDVDNVSNIGAVVTPDGDVLATAEIVMTPTSEDAGHVAAWTDGEKTTDRHVSAADASAAATAQGGGFWGKLNDCLSSAGVASWVVAGISVACAAACVGTAGVGCVACIAAAAGVTGGTAGYCIDQAQK